MPSPSPAHRLCATVEGFCAFIESLPEAALDERAWGPREVLAHLVYWHERYVAQIESRLAGEPVELPDAKFRELNAQAVTLNRSVSVPAMLLRFRRANARLCELYRACDPATLPIQTKQRAKEYSLEEFVGMVEAHIRNHRVALAREWRSGKGTA